MSDSPQMQKRWLYQRKGQGLQVLDEQDVQMGHKKSFSPMKSLKTHLNNGTSSSKQIIQRPSLFIKALQNQQPSQLVKQSLKNPITYLLQHQVGSLSSINKRSNEEIQLIQKLIRHNNIFKDLGFCGKDGESSPKSEESITYKKMIKQICNSIVLLWSQIPNITETKANQVFLILQGKTFQYIPKRTKGVKLEMQQNDEYLMVQKLVQNDYFMQTVSNNKKGLNSSEKYQLMADERTLIGKISDELFLKFFQARILQRTRNLIRFMRRVVIFQNFPPLLFEELSRFIRLKTTKGGQEVIKAAQKTKDLFLVKRGKIQFKCSQIDQTSLDMQKSELYVLSQFDVFGMDTLHYQKTDKPMVNCSALCLTECELYCIDRRILAVVLSSFQGQLNIQQKLLRSIDMNSQIAGQNYQSREQQILSRNVQRIKTSQRKIRDIKLRSFSRNEIRQPNTYIPQKDRVCIRKKQAKSSQTKSLGSAGFNLFQNKTIKSQNSLLNSRQSTDCRFWTLKDTFQAKNSFFKLKKSLNSNHYVIPASEEQPNDLGKRHTALFSNSSLNQFQKIDMKYLQVFSSSSVSKYAAKIKQANDDQFMPTTKSFVPKIRSRSSFFQSNLNPGKIQSDLMKNYVDRKLKNELIRKTQQVLQIKCNTQRNSIKNIKKFYNIESFSLSNKMSSSLKVAKSDKQVTEQLFDRMNNMREYPLLCQMQSQRKRMQSSQKMKQKQQNRIKVNRQVKKIGKDAKINQKRMVIVTNQNTISGNRTEKKTGNAFSSEGSRITSEFN